jgi:hypothetical protein
MAVGFLLALVAGCSSPSPPPQPTVASFCATVRAYEPRASRAESWWRDHPAFRDALDATADDLNQYQRLIAALSQVELPVVATPDTLRLREAYRRQRLAFGAQLRAIERRDKPAFEDASGALLAARADIDELRPSVCPTQGQPGT